MQNGYIERFNGSYRKNKLDAYLFLELGKGRELTQKWIQEYNTRWSYEALGNRTPSEWPLKSRSGSKQRKTPQLNCPKNGPLTITVYKCFFLSYCKLLRKLP
ncbi:integrase core domain-containing protein [Pontibacter sp. 13R65]|uniref:integrase core domain-containing protein n=1 Tax=Pontibacter sp. 13R65 TaxID=3127458 RepID=UPI0039C8EAC0